MTQPFGTDGGIVILLLLCIFFPPLIILVLIGAMCGSGPTSRLVP